ncbi:MAG: endolytic transglycosylase MltG [Acidobacteriota bacterium]|nr:endolytic transglycosylase MltG [Acidobacteriota bacterium]
MKLLKYVLVLIFVLLVAAGAFGFWIYRNLTTPVAHEKANQYVEIPRGSSPAEIINRLNNEGILNSSLPVQLYLRFSGRAANFKSGEYRFASPITPLGVVKKLEEGEERATRLTIIEGWTRFEIAKEIAEKFPPPEPGKTTNPADVMALLNDTSLIADFDPTAKNLEGYLYPDTYSLPREYTPKQAVKALVDRFKKEWKPEFTEKARSLGRTPKEIVTIASLIETESKVEGERPVVASVIYNRLQRNIPIGLDVTYVYAAKLAGAWDGVLHVSDFQRDTPYSSRKYAGLPPTPVASPSASAIRAALNPAQTDYLYYVLNTQSADGSHNFYSNSADFERGKAAYQRWYKEQNEKRNNADQTEQSNQALLK